MNLAHKILEYRKKLGLSQEELSEKLGVSRQSVSKWESGQAKPEVDKLIQMSQLFRISLDELVINSKPVSAPNSPKQFSSKNIRKIGLAWALSILVLVYFFTTQINTLRGQNDSLVTQIRNLNHTLDSTVNSMQETINQLKKDILFQNGLVADYSESTIESDFISGSLTYMIRILPKVPESTHGIILNVTFADGSSQSIETKLGNDQYYAGYVTASAATGTANITLILSTDSGKVNQIAGILSPLATPAIDASIKATLHGSENILAFQKGNIELFLETLCSEKRDTFSGSYSFRINRNDAVSSVFSYTWDSNSSGTVCTQQEGTVVITGSTLIPVTKAFNVDFKIGDVLNVNLVWIANGMERSIPIQTYTRNTDGTMTIFFY